ncbi:MAG: hypothetical protein J4N99_04010, partial [Chloroflexi bacterium]|nr:hypothetical protein [Chloroflexota bacterium]
RFLVTFLREDRIWAFGMQEAQYIAILVLLITVPLLVIKARPVSAARLAADGAPLEPPTSTGRGTRAQRRRRQRGR